MSRTFYNSPRPLEYNVDELYQDKVGIRPENKKIRSYIDVDLAAFPVLTEKLKELGFDSIYKLDSATKFNLADENNFSYEQEFFRHKELVNLCVDYATDIFHRAQLYFMYDKQDEQALNDMLAPIDEILSKKKPKEILKNAIRLIIKEGNGLGTKAVQVVNNLTDEMIATHYNDDFIAFNEKKILPTLRAGGEQKPDENGKKPKSGRLILLHGDPGTGKSHYLRYLLNQNVGRNVLYFPSEMAHALSDPGFVNFIMEYKNSILIIEDGENVLMKRDVSSGPAAANLLNITDGILGDIYQLHVICTFNCHETEIDPALLRKGRLIGKYKFNELSEEKINTLCDLADIPHLNKAMTIGEFYNREDEEFAHKEKSTIGFVKE